jgi:hypothetical protein
MQVYTPILWGAVPSVDYGADTIELARIVPRAGERRLVYLDRHDQVSDGQAISCVWRPPYTDVNGWIEQPSEIASSYVVTGTACLIDGEMAAEHAEGSAYFRHIASTNLAVEIDVHRARPLIETLALAAPDYAFRLPMLGTATGGSMSQWLDSGYVRSAHVAGHIYLTSRGNETLLEALVRIKDGSLVLAYHQYWPPCEMECVILNNELRGDERALFEHLIANAEPIVDSHKQYLV